jgi:hypothetical protein
VPGCSSRLPQPGPEHSLGPGAHFLYWSWPGRCWAAGPRLGGPRLKLRCRQDSPLPAAAGWQFWRWDEWREEAGLRLEAPPPAAAPRLEVLGGPGCPGLGPYLLQPGVWSQGRPVYRRARGWRVWKEERFLAVLGGAWHLARGLGGPQCSLVRGAGGPACPAQPGLWTGLRCVRPQAGRGAAYLEEGDTSL